MRNEKGGMRKERKIDRERDGDRERKKERKRGKFLSIRKKI